MIAMSDDKTVSSRDLRNKTAEVIGRVERRSKA